MEFARGEEVQTSSKETFQTIKEFYIVDRQPSAQSLSPSSSSSLTTSTLFAMNSVVFFFFDKSDDRLRIQRIW